MSKRKNKYNARKVTVDGIQFDSVKEGNRYALLRMLEKRGKISNLIVHRVFKFIIDEKPAKMRNGQTAKYTADFQYLEDGKTIVEDVKGYKITDDYRLRRALVKHLYGIEIKEV